MAARRVWGGGHRRASGLSAGQCLPGREWTGGRRVTGGEWVHTGICSPQNTAAPPGTQGQPPLLSGRPGRRGPLQAQMGRGEARGGGSCSRLASLGVEVSSGGFQALRVGGGGGWRGIQGPRGGEGVAGVGTAVERPPPSRSVCNAPLPLAPPPRRPLSPWPHSKMNSAPLPCGWPGRAWVGSEPLRPGHTVRERGGEGAPA